MRIIKYSVGWILFFSMSLVFAALPSASFVGLANATRFSTGTHGEIEIGIEIPLDYSGWLVNQNLNEGFLPNKFIISDGTSIRPFIGVDRTEGSELDLRIREMVLKIQKNLKISPALLSTSEKEQVLQYIAQHLNEFIDWPMSHSTAQASDDLTKRPSALHDLPIGRWIETERVQPVEAFENILDRKKGVCIDMALLASFLLEKFHISHRIIFGSVQNPNASWGGHTWIELPGGRILDVAWKTLGYPDYVTDMGWRFFGNSQGKQFRFPYLFFSLISLP